MAADEAEGEVERRDYGRDIHLRGRGRERGRVTDIGAEGET
jgi:hypothetical protein